MFPRADSGERASSPVVGVALTIAITVVLASGVAVTLAVDATPNESTATTQVDITVDAATDTLVLEHTGGSALDVTDLRVVVTVNGTQLQHQPPVPFFAATGFVSAPDGPFNPAYGDDWTAGETTTLTIGSTNTPRPTPGDSVTVAIYEHGRAVVTTSTTARNATTAPSGQPRIAPHEPRREALGSGPRHRTVGTPSPNRGQISMSRHAASSVGTDSFVAPDSLDPASSSGTRARVVIAMSGS